MEYRRKGRHIQFEKKYETNEDSRELQSMKGNNIEKIEEKAVYSFYNIYPILQNVYLFASKTICLLLKITGIYLLWICLHYGASHLYIKLCVPRTIFGFIMSPFMVSTPHCQGLRWIVYNAATIINNMWLALGAWIYTLIWLSKENSSASPSST
jgi:hypothetical protein